MQQLFPPTMKKKVHIGFVQISIDKQFKLQFDCSRKKVSKQELPFRRQIIYNGLIWKRSGSFFMTWFGTSYLSQLFLFNCSTSYLFCCHHQINAAWPNKIYNKWKCRNAFCSTPSLGLTFYISGRLDLSAKISMVWKIWRHWPRHFGFIIYFLTVRKIIRFDFADELKIGGLSYICTTWITIKLQLSGRISYLTNSSPKRTVS